MNYKKTARDTQEPWCPFVKLLEQVFQGKKNQGKIFTEDKLIDIYDALPQALWYKYFIEAQNYTMNQNIIHQEKECYPIICEW